MKKNVSSSKTIKYSTDSYYTGQVKNNKPHGKGKYKFNGETYIGGFQNGQYHGKGKWFGWNDEVSIVKYNKGKLEKSRIIKKGKKTINAFIKRIGIAELVVLTIILGIIYLFYSLTIYILT
ncbi:hypothetical protein OAP71_03510 [Pelagibacteraceae bacterium]|jgi:hypothetical protein|nr:hypothetical protein [Pelagibacteraceae bacterium]